MSTNPIVISVDRLQAHGLRPPHLEFVLTIMLLHMNSDTPLGCLMIVSAILALTQWLILSVVLNG